MGDEEAIRATLDQLLKHVTPGTLSELSIQLTESLDMIYELPEDIDYVVLRDSPKLALSISLVQSLTAFRIYGTQFYWDTMSFSSRLADLRIEKVALGYDDKIAPFVRALSSTSNLRDLKIISVSTLHHPITNLNKTSSPLITFPSLESLLLQDLYLNTLESLLPMIAPGSYHLGLRQVVLGGPGTTAAARPDGTYCWKPLEDDSPFVKWLRGDVPDVRSVESDYRPLEFGLDVWKLW